MKKTMVRTLSLLLAILMIGSVVVLSVNAADEVTGFTIKDEPTKKEYYVGETENLILTGLVLDVTYKDSEKTKPVRYEDDTANIKYTGFVPTLVGKQKITVTYFGFSADFEIEVVELDHIAVKDYPEKRYYKLNDTSFDPTGLSVEVYIKRENDSEASLYKTVRYPEEGLKCTGFESQSVGKKPITVIYKNVATSITIEVDHQDVPYIEVVDIMTVEVVNEPNSKTYKEGSEFDPSGLRLKVTYGDGTSETISYDDAQDKSAFKFIGFDSSYEELEKEITPFYKGIEAEKPFKVNVIAIASIKKNTDPLKMNYRRNENTAIDPKGMTLNVFYTDGSMRIETDTDKFEFPDFNTSKSGKHEFTVVYAGHQATFDLHILDIVDLEIYNNKNPRKVYKVNETFDPKGMELLATYSDGEGTEESDVVTTGYDWEHDPSPFLKAGQETVTVTYKGQTLDIDVDVVDVSGIEIYKAPDTTKYLVGQNFDPSGMVLKVLYSNERGVTDQEFVDSGYSYTPDLLNKRGPKEAVTVNYEGYTATQEVKVFEVESIKVTPEKQKYYRYSGFDYYGTQVTVSFSDGAAADNFDQTYSAYELPLTYYCNGSKVNLSQVLAQAGRHEVVVEYRDARATIVVDVIAREGLIPPEKNGGQNPVSISDVKLLFKTTTVLQPVIQVDPGVKKDDLYIHYESANPKVARVDENGKVTGVCWGDTEITITVSDAKGQTFSDTCKVTVRFTILQWIFRSLFGWIENWK